MRKIIVVGILVMAVAMAAPAMAFEKGTIRLGAGTGLVDGTGFSTTSISQDAGGDIDFDMLSIDGGYFITDRLELAFQFASESDDFSDIDIFGVGGKYYFPMGENSVYAGGGLQTLDIDGSDGDFIYGTAGYNWMLKEYFSIDFYVAIGQGDFDGNDFDLTSLGVTYSVYFE
jgi:hypothetical protein